MTVSYPTRAESAVIPITVSARCCKDDQIPFGFSKQFRLGCLLRLNLPKRGVSLSDGLGRFSTNSRTRRLRVSSPSGFSGSLESWSVGVEPVTASTLRR